VFRHTAHVYDLLYEGSGKDYDAESAALHHLIQTRTPGATRLLDVACGTGGHLRHLRRWYEVTGVDIDPGMLAEAHRNVPEVTLIEADMRTLVLDESFDAIVCLFSSVGYLRSTDELTAAVAAMSRHLNAGGILVVDGWVRPDAWISGGKTEVTRAASDAVQVVRITRSRRQGDRTSLEMHHLIGTADGIEYVVDEHVLTLFAPAHYEAAFRASGLTVETVDGPLPGRDRYVGIRAR
jgi:ubiquinone/menaquinone biosynthesis C-methylase UbiE